MFSEITFKKNFFASPNTGQSKLIMRSL